MISRKLMKTSLRVSGLLAAVGLAATATHAANWTTFTPGTYGWTTASNWSTAPNYPGDGTLVDDVASIVRTTAIGGAIVIDAPTLPSSLLGLTVTGPNTAAADTITLNINGGMTVNGNAAFTSGGAANGRVTLNVNNGGNLAITGNMTTNTGTSNNTRINVLQGGTLTVGAVTNALGVWTIDGNMTTGSLLANNNDAFNFIVSATAGNVDLGNFTMTRTSITQGAGGVGGSAITDDQAAFANRGGLHIRGGVVTINNFSMGNAGGNSSTIFELSGGTVTVNGTFNVGNGGNTRAHVIGHYDGIMNVGNVNGIVLGSGGSPGTYVLRGGTLTTERIAMGTNGGNFVTGGTGVAYIGSGGIVNTGTNYQVALGFAGGTGGTIGAKANWSSSSTINLYDTSGASFIKAADANNAPFDISLSGNLVNVGGFTKTGGGKLLLSGTGSTYSGPTFVQGGSLIVNTPIGGTATGTSSITVQSGGTYGGVGNDENIGVVMVESGGTVAPGVPGVLNGVGTLNFKTLSLADGSTLTLDFVANPASNDRINFLSFPQLTLGSQVFVNVYASGSTTTFNVNGDYKIFTNINPGSFTATVDGSNVVTNLVWADVGSPLGHTFKLVPSAGDPTLRDIVLTITGGITPNKWTGAASSDWGTAGNWTVSVPNAPGAVASFGGTAVQYNVNVGTRTVGSLSFDSGTNSGYTLGGGQITLNNNGGTAMIDVAGGNNTISSALVLADNTTIGTLLASNTLTITGPISSGAGRNLSIVGPGLIILAGTNTYGATSIAAGSRLQLGDGGSNGSFGTGAVTNDGQVILNFGFATTIASAIDGSGTLTQAGTGVVTLTGLNSYTGRTVVNAGSGLVVDYTNGGGLSSITGVFSPGTITFRGGPSGGLQTFTTALNLQGGTINVEGGTGGTMDVTFASANLGNNGAVNVTGNTGVASLALGNVTFGTGNMLNVGGTVGGSLSLSSATIPDTAQIHVNSGGTVNLTAATTTFANGSTVTVGGGSANATLFATASVINPTASFSVNSNGVAFLGNTTFNGLSSLAINGGTATLGNMTLPLRAEITLGGGASTLDTGGFTRTGVGAVNITGTGTIVTTNASTGIIGGWATLNGMDFAAVNAGAVVPSTSVNNTWAGDNVSVTANTVVPSGSTANSLRFKTPGAFTVTLSGENTLTSGAILVASQVGANTSTITGGTIVPALGQEIVLNQRNATGNLVINSNITGTGSALTKLGPGTVVLAGVVNPGGTISVVEGVVRLGSSTTLNSTSGLSVSASGLVELDGFNARVGSLAGTGSITNSAGTASTLNVHNNAAVNYTGVVTGNVNLFKSGTGALNIRAVQSYTGTTTVADGNLVVDFQNSGAANNNLLPPETNLILKAGGSIQNTSAADETNLQQFASTLLNDGHSSALQQTRQSNGHPYLLLGAITRNPGATFDVTPNTGSSGTQTDSTTGIFTSNQNGLSGMLAGWMTVNNTDWAFNNGAASAADPSQAHIYGLPGGSYTNSIGSNLNTNMTASITAGGPDNVTASVRFGTAAATTLDLVGGTNTIETGGILVTAGTGANVSTITGGNLTSGNGTDLIIFQHNTNAAGGLVIASNIVNAPVSETNPTGVIGLTKAGNGTVSLNGASNYSGTTWLNAGQVTYGGGNAHSIGAVRGSGNGRIAVAASSTLTSDSVVASGWQVDGTHNIRAGAGTSRTAGLTIAGGTGAWTGKLDLAGNSLVITAATGDAQAAAIATLRDQIASGRAGGVWTGTGITSSTLAAQPNNGLALVDAGDLNIVAFGGQAGLDANSTIITVARNGDASLDNVVDAFDLNILAANWQTADKIWSSGDFTGDGIVDAFDLNALAANWQFGVGGSLEAALAAFPVFGNAAVPEPASLAVLALGGATLLGRRRRKA